MTYGEILRENRIRLRFTMKEAARVIGISCQYLSEIERGKRKCLNDEKFEDACCLYGITGAEKEILKKKAKENTNLPQLPPDIEMYIRRHPEIIEEIKKIMEGKERIKRP